MAARDLSPTSTSSTLSNIVVHCGKHNDRSMSSASPSSSTPPTSLDDTASILSETIKPEQSGDRLEHALAARASEMDVDDQPQPASEAPPSEGRRSARSSRKSVTTYNVQILAGTAIHTPTKYLEKHHKNVLHGSLEELTKREYASPPKKRTRLQAVAAEHGDPVEEQLVEEAAQAARRRTSSRVTDLRKEALRNVTGVGELVTNTFAGGRRLLQNTLRKTASEPNLKAAKLAASAKSSKRTRAQMEEDEDSDTDSSEPAKVFLKPKTKDWLRQGLYVGQDRDFDPRLSESRNRARKRAKKARDHNVLPLPMFGSDRLLNEDPRKLFKDFKLPFDTYNPLPRKVKVDGWVKLGKNRFIGDASALWKRDKQDNSQCYCDEEDGCGEACHNRIMAYECDDTNCRLTPEQCGNRPFAELKRRAKGNRYDYGVEVMDTEDRGYGVRAMRTFRPHQIIVEYAGEIITQQECERRMKQVYKKDKCYYLMSFDNKMIIDATRGTIARFVNHCCEPNCEMIKWTVNGEPRMALFAGARGIMTGEELTYDYNFDPFSQKNIQECRCGTESCRGVLGPKPKKPVEDKTIASAILAGTKRKLQSLLGARKTTSQGQASPKKRKLQNGSVADTKMKNAQTAVEKARERAEREAEEHTRQIASRENRALKRSAPIGMTRRGRAQQTRTQLPTVKSTRITKVSFVHKNSKPGALKAINKGSRASKPSKQASSTAKNTRSAKPVVRPSTPVQSESESESDAESVNITPASLRSASKKLQPSKPTEKLRLGRTALPKQKAGNTKVSRTTTSGRVKKPAALKQAAKKVTKRISKAR